MLMDNNYGKIDYGTYKDDYVITAYELISNKWKLKILKYIKPHRPVRYGELLNYVDGITKKVLTDNLKSLEDDGLEYNEGEKFYLNQTLEQINMDSLSSPQLKNPKNIKLINIYITPKINEYIIACINQFTILYSIVEINIVDINIPIIVPDRNINIFL